MENINNDLQTILSRLTALEKENASLSAQLTANWPLPKEPTREPKVGLPDKFDGNRSKYRGFINQMDLLFMINPQRYPTDAVKIGTIGTLLTGNALTWFSPFLEKPMHYAECLSDYSKFKDLMDRTFADIDRVTIAATKIRKLSQGKQPCATYASSFRLLAADLDWNDAALIQQFRFGLNDDVKDMLLHYDHPDTLDAAISLAIQIDNRLFERKQERFHSMNANANETQTLQRRVTTTKPLDQSTPMEIDTARRGPLSESEKKYRRENNLCLYCGSNAHFRQSCPLIRPRVFNAAASGKDQGQ
jgi:hypothetical protein